jgi:hypothetical protein
MAADSIIAGDNGQSDRCATWVPEEMCARCGNVILADEADPEAVLASILHMLGADEDLNPLRVAESAGIG